MMAAEQSQVLFFGDLSSDFDAGLSDLVVRKDNPLLITFFERVAFAIRAEIGKLPLAKRDETGLVRFTTFIELITRLRKSPSPSPALEKALTCVHQFARFISFYSSGSQTYPKGSNTRILGLCTGLLTAAAISCCKSLSELIPVAVQTVVVAFRTGLCVSDVRVRIAPTTDSLAAWSVLVPGLTEATVKPALERYGNDKALPIALRPYVSAYAENNVTLSGHPAALDDLLRSDYLPKSTFRKYRIRGPYHAPHLYDTYDLDSILETTAKTSVASYPQSIAIIHGYRNENFMSEAFGSVIRSALTEILLEPIRLSKMTANLVADVKSSKARQCTILPVANPSALTLVSALKHAGVQDVTVNDTMNSSLVTNVGDVNESGHFAHSKLAIVGFSGRYPDAKDNDEFWQLLYEGRDVASEAPATRWDIKTHVDPTGKKKNTSATPYGCWLKEAGLFDAKFFAMTPREAPQVDPAQRLSLLTAHEALENAGIIPDATPSTRRDRVGVFSGTASNDWGETNSSQDIDTYYIPGSCRAFIPGKQNYHFKFSGPSFSIDTACSSSLAAMHIACNALWQGDVDTAICGGTNVTTNPDITAGLDRGHFLSRTGNCKTFDETADGYCRGEGVATVVIKRLEDAQADNDPIIATILGAYTNHSAEAESITRPHAGAQKDIFQKVLTHAGIKPYDVSYVEMHGTGTQAGDAREMESVLATFADRSWPKMRDESQKLHIGSLKSNVGHGESVSGILALIKVLLMMEHSIIPPHCGIKTRINPAFPTDFAERNVHIALKAKPWLRPANKPRRAFINNFSAAGGNSSVLLEDAPLKLTEEQPDPRSSHMVAISAKSDTALTNNIRALLEYLKQNKVSLPSLSYTTTARRSHHNYRVIANGQNISEITAQLEKMLSTSQSLAWPRSGCKTAFAFTGQGSQYPGMAKELLKFSSFRKDFERFDSIAQKQGFPALMPLIVVEGGDIADWEPLVVQLATVCIQMAMARLWRSWGIEPIAVVGHSLGEYAALNVAGVLSDLDTIYLTGTRARLLQDKCTRFSHAMLAVAASLVDIHKLLEGKQYEVACKNGPAETVLSGTNEQIDTAAAVLKAAGRRSTKLKVPFAFHSSQVEVMLDEFERQSKAIVFQAPKVPVICPLLGNVVDTAGTFGASYLGRHCRETVDFLGSIAAAKASILTENTQWVEIGPHPILSGLLKSNLSSVSALPTLQRGKDSWKVLTSSLCTLFTSGAPIVWSEYQRDFKYNLSVLRLPAYKWDLKNYWMQYVNDWSLYKGDAAFLSGAKTGLSTTSVQKIVEETSDGNKLLVVGESDLQEQFLEPIARGHKINGVPLATPSLYCDMALTLGEYLRKKDPKLAEAIVDVQHMDVQRPLVTKAKGSGPQPLRCRIELDKSSSKGSVEFWSMTPEGKKLTRHAIADITFPNKKTSLAKTSENAPQLLARMAEMRKQLTDNERLQKLNRNAGYKMVASLATYADEYKGVEEVILDSENKEATAKVRFDKKPKGGIFHVDPNLIDNFGQPALFCMNANDQSDLEKEVFVNHGWQSLHFYKEVSIDKTYHSHVKMSGPNNDGMYSGDVVVFEGTEVVATYKGVKAQGVPRRLMDYIVHMRDDTKKGAPVGGTTGAAPAAGALAPGAQQQATTVVQTAQATVAVTVATGEPDHAASWPAALNIIAEESRIDVSELKPEVAFSDLGVDSLLCLLCASRFREELGVDYDSSIFGEYLTVKDLEIFWKAGGSIEGAEKGSSDDRLLDSMFHDNVQEDDEEPPKSEATSESFEVVPEQAPKTLATKAPATTSLLLQGNPASPNTTKTLFLLPDGSGSSSSYASIPRLNPTVAVVGLNSPYMKIPEQYNTLIAEASASYINEIRRRQLHGPYALGGWSVGGIFAYHVAQQLVELGEAVSDIILIDCPVPRGLDHLPHRYYEYCDKIGLLGEGPNGVRRPPPPWLIGHFEACVNSLHTYVAAPFSPREKSPKVKIIWASEAIDEHCSPKFDRRPNDPEGLKFLTEARKDFGPNGWETLLDESKFTYARSKANHFSMMKAEPAETLKKAIEEALVPPN